MERKMSKAEFIANVADAGDMSNAEAKRVVELVFGEIEKGLKKSKKEGKYTIGTFGTFTITKRAARKGRNPRTGEEIKIKASKSLRFRPASNLKEAAGCK
ncbi:HU family DNA-binding protein [Parvularcula sp. IMCC14364]|uniref:HU family DNA-binding protein n=1 Tax=Parvularcula sp. IMCC14364 TaxID=3067902 RepID=UPI003556D031